MSLKALSPLLAALLLAPAGVPTAWGQGAAVLGLTEMVRSLRRDAVEAFSGRRDLSLQELKRRADELDKALEASSGSLQEPEKAKFKRDIERISSLIERAEAANLPAGSLAAFSEALKRDQDKADPVETLGEFFEGLEGAGQDPRQAEWVFERMRQRVRGNPDALRQLEGVERDFKARGIEFADSSNPRTNDGKPRDIQLVVPLARYIPPAPTPAPSGADVRAAAGAASGPFLNLLPGPRQAFFVSERRRILGELMTSARDALTSLGSDPSTFVDGAAMVERLTGTEERIYKELGYTGAPANGDEHAARMRALFEKNRALAYFLIKLSRYRIFVQQALQDEAVPSGTAFEAWEIGHPEKTSKIEYREEAQDGLTYSGFKITDSQGLSRFQGQSDRGAFGLIVIENPAEKTLTRTVVEFGGASGKEIVKTETELFQTGSGAPRRVRREIGDVLKKLTTVILFDETGGVEREQVVSGETGQSRVTDHKQGLVITSEKDRSTSIVAIPGSPHPSPFKAQYGLIDENGRFAVSRIEMPEDKVVLFLSKRVIKLIGRENGREKLLGFEIKVEELVNARRSQARLDLAREVAREILDVALVAWKNDPKYFTPLVNFLYDYVWKPLHPDAVSVRLTIDDGNGLNVLYELRDQTKVIYNAKYLPGTAYKGQTSAASLVLMNPILIDAGGKASQDPRRKYEYAAEGHRLEWSDTTSDEKGGVFAADKKHYHTWLEKQIWKGDLETGNWVPAEEAVEHAKKTEEIPHSSWLGKVSHGATQLWGVKHVLEWGGAAGKTILAEIMAAPQWIIGELGDSSMYNLEAVATDYANPARRALTSDAEFLAQLKPEAKEELKAKALENRRKGLIAQGYDQHRAPDAYNNAMAQPVTEKEMAQALGNFGAFSYGSRMFEMAAAGEKPPLWADVLAGIACPAYGLARLSYETTGYGLDPSSFYAIGGIATTAFMNIAETTFNPAVWATFGLGRAVVALQGVNAGSTIAKVTLGALTLGTRGMHWYLTGAMLGSWAFGAVDNLGQVVQHLGDDDKTKLYEAVSHVATDAFFGFLMWKGMKEGREARRKAMEELDAKNKGFEKAYEAIEAAEAAEAAAKSGAGKAAPTEAPGANKGPNQAALDKAKIEGAELVEGAQKRAQGGLEEGPTQPSQAPAQAKPQQKAPESKAQQNAPETKTQEKAPETQTQEKAPETKTQEKAPETKTQEKAPETKTQEKAPETQTQEKAPETQIQEKAPESKPQEAAPESKTSQKPRKPRKSGKKEGAEPEAEAEAKGPKTKRERRSRKESEQRRTEEKPSEKAPEKALEKPAETAPEAAQQAPKPEAAQPARKHGKGKAKEKQAKPEETAEAPKPRKHGRGKAKEKQAKPDETAEAPKPRKHGKGKAKEKQAKPEETAEAPKPRKHGRGKAKEKQAKPKEKASETPSEVVDALAKGSEAAPKKGWFRRWAGEAGSRLRNYVKYPVVYTVMPDPDHVRSGPPAKEKRPEEKSSVTPMPEGDSRKKKEEPKREAEEPRREERRAPERDESAENDEAPASQPASVSAASGGSGGAGGSGGGESRGPNALNVSDPFGGGGASGGGGGASGGSGGGGGGGSAEAALPAPAPAASAPAPAASAPSPVFAPAPAAAAPAPAPAAKEEPRRPAETPAARSLASPPAGSPSLSSRFDGANDKKQAFEPKPSPSSFGDAGAPMRPLGKSASKPAASEGAAPAGRESEPEWTSAGQDAPARAQAGPGMAEDYSNTTLAPARHKYEMPGGSDGEREMNWWLSLLLRVSAAGAASSLLMKSDLPFLLGLSRKRRAQ